MTSLTQHSGPQVCIWGPFVVVESPSEPARRQSAYYA
nr:MAG TPA: hypothetical protein [Caudoviricetes sp.]